MKKSYDFKRAYVFFILGTFYIAPALHVQYTKILPYFVPKITIPSIFLKVGID